MIKANELRIGNYITAKGAIDPLENYLTVCGLDERSITTKYFSHEGQCWQIVRNKDNYTGIPLIEEWLTRLGATRMDESNFRYSRFSLIWKEGYDYWYIIDSELLSYITKIEFVHEWQNFVLEMNREQLKPKSND